VARSPRSSRRKPSAIELDAARFPGQACRHHRGTAVGRDGQRRATPEARRLADDAVGRHDGAVVSGAAITVTLGDLQQGVKARVKSGAYASASEVMRAALRALDREEAAINDWLRQRIDDSLADARPNLPADKVFKRLRAHHAGRLKARRSEEI
jgi:antitoxin ParD1/3/4